MTMSARLTNVPMILRLTTSPSRVEIVSAGNTSPVDRDESIAAHVMNSLRHACGTAQARF